MVGVQSCQACPDGTSSPAGSTSANDCEPDGETNISMTFCKNS